MVVYWADNYLQRFAPTKISGVFKKAGIHIYIQNNRVYAETTEKLAPHMPLKLKYTMWTKTLRPTKAANITNRTNIHDSPNESDGIGSEIGRWILLLFIRTFNSNRDRAYYKWCAYGKSAWG